MPPTVFTPAQSAARTWPMIALPYWPRPFAHWYGAFCDTFHAGMNAQKTQSLAQVWVMVGKSWSRTSGRQISFRVTTSGAQLAMTRCASGTDWPPSKQPAMPLLQRLSCRFRNAYPGGIAFGRACPDGGAKPVMTAAAWSGAVRTPGAAVAAAGGATPTRTKRVTRTESRLRVIDPHMSRIVRAWVRGDTLFG